MALLHCIIEGQRLLSCSSHLLGPQVFDDFLHLTKVRGELCKKYTDITSGHGIYYFHPYSPRTQFMNYLHGPYNCKGGWEVESKCVSGWHRYQGMVNIYLVPVLSLFISSSVSIASSPSREKLWKSRLTTTGITKFVSFYLIISKI